MTIYGHYIKYGPKYSDHIRSVIPLLVYFRPPAGYFTAALSSLCTYESTLKPSGRCCPASNSTSVSRILASTCSDGSSVRTFFFPRTLSYAKHVAPEFVCSIRLGRHIRALTHSQFRNIAFVNVQPYAQNGIARHHNHRRIELCRDALPVVPQLPQNHTIDRRTDITLLEVRAPWLPPPPRERDPLVNSSLFRVQSRRFASFAYLFTAIACSSKCPPRSSAPAPINSRAGKSVVVK